MSNKIEFSQPANFFEEAFPVGNSYMGAMYYGNPEKSKLSLNLDSMWSGNGRYKGKKKSPKYFRKAVKYMDERELSKAAKMLKEKVYGDDSEGYLPLGNLFVESEESDYSQYNRRLDMESGVVSADYKENDSTVSETVFCSYPDKVLSYKIASTSNTLNRKIYFDSAFPTQKKTQGNIISVSGICPDECNPIKITNGCGAIKYCCSFLIKTDGELFGDSSVKIQNASYIEIYFFGDTTYYNKNISEYSVNFHLSETSDKGYEALLGNHVEDYRKLYGRSNIELSGNELCDKSQTLFNFGKYLMISCSRGKTLPANLQGIWSESKDPIWYCAYTMNINLEMNYWGTDKVGLHECLEPLVDFVSDLKSSGEITAKSLFDSDGWCAFHNSDIWHMTTPVGNSHDGDPSAHAWFAGAAGWLCLPLYEHYLYTEDKKYLMSTALPIIEGACRFYLDTMSFVNDEYVMIPGASPENTYIYDKKERKLCAGTTMDSSIIKGLFLCYIKCCDDLQIEPFIYQRVNEVVKKIREPQTGSDGRILEWDKEYGEQEEQHRHISHLYFNFPESLNPDGKYDDAIKKSLEKRGLGGTGWSIAWKINQFARLHDGNTAFSLIERYLTPVEPSTSVDYSNGGGTYPNMFCAHPPFQIDGNFGVMSGIAEMLMQDCYGKIELLPALPDDWKSGSVSGFVAKGGYTVCFEWNDGKVTKYKISHNKEMNCRVVVNGECLTVETNKEYICE